ncbi:PAS/PAC sensor hybrid histidine kinase [Nitrospirillum viridazoti Y2]|uniref:histidine kinase n=1 Tax=Nitrospirillum amazonense TaxID=28077 RepID=A0A560ICA1_9PROT|nr:response regulator [Nitrospirillum amazonense]EGY01078.1 PAS/PAC sensor hybrid histidine kinase [Nitrospirillum amazonense Y2]TWB56668.1 PAS domain S-box-containing protein [Nitrospirillum amazonense]
MSPAAEKPVALLLVEDSDIDAELIAHQFRKIDQPLILTRVAVRGEYEAALAGGDFDIILSDYSLPGFNGLAALELARARDPAVPFIFISGVIGEEFATEALRAGATDYVTKRNLARIPMVVTRALREAEDRRQARRSAQALRESEQRFRSMADNTPALIWSSDAEGRIIFANRRFETEFGIPPARMEAEGWAALIHEDDWPTLSAVRRALFVGRTPFLDDMRVRKATGEVRWLRCESSPRFDDAGTFLGFLGCAIDITETKLARDALEAEVVARTEELRVKEEALRQSHKMEAIGQLTGGIAHDFNNMLAGIVGAADLIQKRVRDARFDSIGRYVDNILSSAHRAAGLTHRLLAFARRQTLDLKSADINQLVSSLDDLLRRTLGQGIDLQISLAPEVWPAITDANQFESAILNLAINARDAMTAGGRLTIQTSNVTIGDGDERASADLQPGDYVLTCVTDTGTGMPPEVLEKAFDPFFTTKPIGHGTGLGLSMIYGFARQVGGHVTLASTPGKGTTICLYMPRDRSASAAAEAPRPNPPEATPKGRGTVLVVEDELVVRMVVVDILEEHGYGVIEAETAADALPHLEGPGTIDLLLTDVGLPGMNGRALAHEARRLRPGLKILFATGYAEGASQRSAFVGDGMDYIAKPFDLDELGRKIRALTEG